jgi:hypothetical protein
MISSNQIIKAIKSKKSNRECARKLGVSLNEFMAKKKEFVTSQFSETEKDMYVIALEEKIIEFSENVSEGTAKIKGISLSEPHSAEDIEKILKIDKDKWKLSTYWNKQHKDSKGVDYWVISAMITKKQESELSVEDIDALLTKVFNKVKNVPIKTTPSTKLTNNKALFIYTSDKHIAAYVNDKEAIYKNDYGKMSFQVRMLNVLYEVYYLVNLFGQFEDIFIIDLGDRMDGMHAQTTRGGHKLPQNMSDKEAFETAITVEKEFYDRMFQSEYSQNYHIISNACSNHGGIFDYMVSRALEIYVNATYPFVKTSVQEKFIDHIEYGKHVLIFTHGKDTEDMKHGMPLHMNDKTENYLNKYLMYNDIDPKSKQISVIKGDLHKDTSESTYNFRYRNVLSLFGGSKWIATNFGPSKSGCSFDVVEKETTRIFEHKILF